jgi:hypothetical protein
VEICPPQCLTFGRRSELIGVAHRLIQADPSRYVDHIYGETEVGGSSWLYLAGRPFSSLGFPALGPASPARLTESLQHGLFRDFVPPLALFAVLATIMGLFKPDAEPGEHGREESP